MLDQQTGRIADCCGNRPEGWWLASAGAGWGEARQVTVVAISSTGHEVGPRSGAAKCSHEWGREGDLGDWHVRRFARCEWGGWT